MKLIDQYIYAISKKLPYNSKKEITEELRSLLLDEIDEQFGPEPNDEQLKSYITNFGSPAEVAHRYNPNHLVIGSGFTDLYFLIIKIMALSITLAFTTIYIIELIKGDFTLAVFAFGFIKVILNTISAVLPGIGVLTLVMIVTTRIYSEETALLKSDWTPDDLKDVEVSLKTNSVLESIFTIIFTMFALVLINVTPTLISIAEQSFEKSTLTLGHYVNIDLFKNYLIFISILWIGQIIYHILLLFTGTITRKLALYNLCLEILSGILFISLLTNMNMYSNYTSLLGFRAIFALIAVINIIEIISKIYKLIKYYSNME